MPSRSTWLFAALVPLMLAACDANGAPLIVSPLNLTPQVIQPRPAPSPTPTPTALESAATPTAAPVANNPPGASPAPATLPPLSPGCPAAGCEPSPGTRAAVLRGMVYDPAGSPVDGATVSLRSLQAGLPYTGRAKTDQGVWFVNDVPEGVIVEVTAAKAGWTTRRRTGSFSAAAGLVNVMEFGGLGVHPTPDQPLDASGAAYFISNYPEVAHVALHPGLETGHLTLVLTLSEALDVANQHRFEQAVRLLPANAPAGAANPGDLTSQVLGPEFIVPPDELRMVQAGSAFQNNSSAYASFKWDVTGTTATLDFDGHVLSTGGGALYQAALVSGAGVVADSEGNALGQAPDGAWLTADGPANGLVRRAFLPSALQPLPSASNGRTRWAATHVDAALLDPSTAWNP